MSVKRVVAKTKFVAKLATEEKGPCAFCQRDIDDELIYGKLYAIGSIKCHYFCVLLSCCMVQKGKDEDGLFGFLYPDILAEIERSKKHKCSYCQREGATLGCSVGQCRYQFHLPCGREKNAVSLFYGSYKSFCQKHAPKQKIDENIMAKARVRMQAERKKMKAIQNGEQVAENTELESVCVICYERVPGFPHSHTFWPPCCARDAWFHRECLQRMALSAGMHYLKCPLCNDKKHFYDAVVGQGYYVPDRDAAWELEQNAFADIYERPLHCDLEKCLCDSGRGHDDDTGPWHIALCLLCGSSGAHGHCLRAAGSARLLCARCRSAPTDVEVLADTVEAAIVAEQAKSGREERRPVMPSRMSLRRTKPRMSYNCASSSGSQGKQDIEEKTQATASSRKDLNLKPPKRRPLTAHAQVEDSWLLSPNKLMAQICDRLSGSEVAGRVLQTVTKALSKPQPLSVKRKIVENILKDMLKSRDLSKNRSPIKEWCSPKKCSENAHDATEPAAKGKSPKAVSPYKSPMKTPKKSTQAEPMPKTPIILTYRLDKSDSNTLGSPINLDTPSPKAVELDCEHNSADNNDKTLEENIDSANCNDKISKEIDRANHDDKISKEIDSVNYNDKISKEIDIANDNYKISNHDESSNSTFQLPPEFIAEDSNSLPIFDTPKLKKVDVKELSLEISEDDEVVIVNVIKMEQNTVNTDSIDDFNVNSPNKCPFKFNPLENEVLEAIEGFNLKNFNNMYLNEVGRNSKCKFKHNHSDTSDRRTKLRTAIDFAMEASNEKKRSLEQSEEVPKKKRKVSKVEKKKRKALKKYKRTEIELSDGNDNLKLSLQKRKKKAKGSKDKEIKLKIKWKKKRVQVSISKAKMKDSKLTQYVLKYEDQNKPILEKPQYDVTPLKRKYVKLEKSPDNLKQTSIQSFFRKLSPKVE